MPNTSIKSIVGGTANNSASTFGIFDAFPDEKSRQAHLNGPIAQALMAKAEELFAVPPTIDLIEVLGMKNLPTAA